MRSAGGGETPDGSAAGSSGDGRLLGVLALALLAIAAFSIGLALVTHTGWQGALLVAVAFVAVGDLGLHVIGRRRRADRGRAARSTSAAATERADALAARVSELERALGRDRRRTEAITELGALLPEVDAVSLIGDRAPAPDVLVFLLRELRDRRPALVVECGSGVTTLWLALAVREWELDTGIVALDHDDAGAELTRAALRRHGVEAWAEIRDAPLRRVRGLDGHPTAWYDVRELDDLEDIGLLFVDGPPETTGPLARYPAVPLLRDRLASEATIVLDDPDLVGGQEIGRAWADLLPDFDVDRRGPERTAVLRRC